MVGRSSIERLLGSLVVGISVSCIDIVDNWRDRFIAAGVATAARPSTGILDAANDRSAINAVEAVAWVNAVLYLFNVLLCFAVFWSAKTHFWIPTVEDYLHAVEMEQESERQANKMDTSQVTPEGKYNGKME